MQVEKLNRHHLIEVEEPQQPSPHIKQESKPGLLKKRIKKEDDEYRSNEPVDVSHESSQQNLIVEDQPVYEVPLKVKATLGCVGSISKSGGVETWELSASSSVVVKGTVVTRWQVAHLLVGHLKSS